MKSGGEGWGVVKVQQLRKIRGHRTCDCMRCNTFKQVCISFVKKLGASEVAIREVCRFDGWVI